MKRLSISFFFFFNDTATTEIYTLSLHDALPIWGPRRRGRGRLVDRRSGRRERQRQRRQRDDVRDRATRTDRKSTRLNSSHANISYAVFCLKKKNQKLTTTLEAIGSHKGPPLYSA